MPFKSTNNSFGHIAVTLHWLTAILVIALIGTGFRAAGSAEVTAKVMLLKLHVPMGIAVLVLTIARLLWWALLDKKPTALEAPLWQTLCSRFVHLLLYVVLLGMAASGIGMLILSGAGEVLFNGSTGMLPDFSDYKPRVPHGIGARLMIALFTVHAFAALYHHFLKKDGLLSRIWYTK